MQYGVRGLEKIMNSEVKIGGFGGQGVILAGIIIGKAATIYDRKNAVLTQSFGQPSIPISGCLASSRPG